MTSWGGDIFLFGQFEGLELARFPVPASAPGVLLGLLY